MAKVLGVLPSVPDRSNEVRRKGGGIPAILRPEFPGHVHLRSGNVCVHVNPAGHDHQAGEVVNPVGFD